VVKVIREKDNATRLIGYNSDIIGFQESIRPLINTAIHKKALILGTGGASKAVKGALDALDIEWICVSRTPSEGQLSYSDIDSHVMKEYSVIVNTSPLGTFSGRRQCPPTFPYTLLTDKHLLFDLVYNPAETKFFEAG
jgi:shikimate dehydrogenase (EC 1.1.1.25)